MADPSEKYEDNIGGFSIIEEKKVSFYVDKECIFCNVCIEAAPNNFTESHDADHDYVYKQPENQKELEECYDALDQCPVDAIGDDDYE